MTSKNDIDKLMEIFNKFGLDLYIGNYNIGLKICIQNKDSLLYTILCSFNNSDVRYFEFEDSGRTASLDIEYHKILNIEILKYKLLEILQRINNFSDNLIPYGERLRLETIHTPIIKNLINILINNIANTTNIDDRLIPESITQSPFCFKIIQSIKSINPKLFKILNISYQNIDTGSDMGEMGF